MSNARLNVFLCVSMLVLIPLLYSLVFELQSLKERTASVESEDFSSSALPSRSRAVVEAESNNSNTTKRFHDTQNEELVLSFEKCAKETAFLFFGDSTIRGVAACIINNLYGDAKNYLEGPVHNNQQYTKDGYRFYFQYFPQLKGDHFDVPEPFKYHRGDEVVDSPANTSAVDDPIDYFESLHRAYRETGDRRRVVVLVGGIALNEDMLNAVLEWQKHHAAGFRIVVKSNGPRLPMFQGIHSEIAHICFGKNGSKEQSEEYQKWCPRLYKWNDEYMEINERLRSLVMDNQDARGLNLEWMDLNPVLYQDWPYGVREDHCMCHFHYHWNDYVECYPSMLLLLKSFLTRACAV